MHETTEDLEALQLLLDRSYAAGGEHLHRRPQVTATHLPGEELSVTVHGRAVFVNVRDPQHLGFRQTLLEIYTPRYGEEWEKFLDSGPEHVRIDADRMFTFHMDS
jgi:nitroimidazol reductase NimA-like FMN-containing flavoprotein (pyridoxamine 5'-phosphate oxidase superfamily)